MPRIHRICFFLCLTVVVVAGCATAVPVRDLGPDSPELDRLRAMGARHPATFVTTADSTYRFVGVGVSGGRLTLHAHADSLTVSLDAVRSIEFSDPARGALEGVGAGVLVAGVAGLLGAALSAAEPAGSESRTDRGLLVGAAVGVFTIPIGFVIGIGGGHRTWFQFPGCSECGRSSGPGASRR